MRIQEIFVRKAYSSTCIALNWAVSSSISSAILMQLVGIPKVTSPFYFQLGAFKSKITPVLLRSLLWLVAAHTCSLILLSLGGMAVRWNSKGSWIAFDSASFATCTVHVVVRSEKHPMDTICSAHTPLS